MRLITKLRQCEKSSPFDPGNTSFSFTALGLAILEPTGVGNISGTGNDIHFANGFDLITLGNYLPLIIHDKQLLAIYDELEKQSTDTSNGDLYNSVDITPAIQKVSAFQEQLKKQSSPKI